MLNAILDIHHPDNNISQKDLFAKIDILSDDQISHFLTQCLNSLIKGNHLSTEQMSAIMYLVMTNKCPDVLLSAIIVALRIKGETITEISACAKVMLSLANCVHLTGDNLVDIVGTGGDGANLFNISTACAFVMACNGATVVKHGSTGVSTKNGSSDLLSQANIALLSNQSDLQALIDSDNMAFLFAPNHHPAMRFAKPVRASLKTRTIFNILGPLTNPAHIKNALIGAYSQTVCCQIGEVMQHLGANHIISVHSDDGLDEISLSAPTFVTELKNNKITHYTINPEQFGITPDTLDGLIVKNSEQSLRLIKDALAGKTCDKIIQKAQNIIALNAGFGLYVAGVANSPQLGISLAQDTLKSDIALQKMQNFAKNSQILAKNSQN